MSIACTALVLFAFQKYVTIFGISAFQPNAEHRLRSHLFNRSLDPTVRPVRDTTQNVTVYIDVSLNYLVDMDEKQQVLRTEVAVRLIWKDEHVLWDPDEFGNLSVIHVDPGKIWRPDIVIYNNVGLEGGRDPLDYLMAVHSDGTVNWNFPRTVETSCKLDVYKFPFDRQHCTYVFGSWAFDGNLMDVRNSSARGDTKNYVDNGEWFLVEIVAERHEVYYECCPHAYPDVTFTLVLERHSTYYVFNIIFPYLLITLLHLTSFLLPAESGEKISLNVTILLGLTVFLLLVAEIMPPQSEVIPAIAQYFGICILQVSLSLLANVFILHLNFRGARGFPVPPWMRSVILKRLGCILCYANLVRQTSTGQHRKRGKQRLAVKKNSKGTATKVDLTNSRVSPLATGEIIPNEDTSASHACARSAIYRQKTCVLKSERKPTMEDLSVVHMRNEGNEKDEKAIIQDWILISLILDRFFFLLFGLLELATFGYLASSFLLNRHGSAH